MVKQRKQAKGERRRAKTQLMKERKITTNKINIRKQSYRIKPESERNIENKGQKKERKKGNREWTKTSKE